MNEELGKGEQNDTNQHSEIGRRSSQKKKSSAKNLNSTFLIIAGLIIIAIPLVGKIVTDQRQQNMMNTFYLELENDQVAQDSEVNMQLDEALLWGNDVQNQEEVDLNAEAIGSEQMEDATIKKMPKAIGIIKIDKINVELPIAEGVSLDVLKFAVGHMPGTAKLGEVGNCALAGHRSHTFGSFFNRLDEVAVGDEVEVEKGDGSLVTYVVYEKRFVEPDDLSVLNSSSKYKVLTLITCHPEINPTKRLIIHAKVKE